MKTLEQIKNDYAKSRGFADWEDLMTKVCYFDNEEFFNQENELLILVQKECLKNASENADIKYSFYGNDVEINKESITNEKNIIR